MSKYKKRPYILGSLSCLIDSANMLQQTLLQNREGLCNIGVVRQAGIEPAAFTFGVCYSIP